MFNKTIFIAFTLILGFSCTKKSTPETALREFIGYRFKGGQTKDDLLEMTTGSLNQRISDLEGKELEEFLKIEDLRKKSIKVLLKNCESEKCYLTYILRYGQGKSDPKDFGVEVKKIAQVQKEGETWKVSEISNVKTYIEAKKDLEVSSEGESSPVSE